VTTYNQALRPRVQTEITGLASDITPFNVISHETEAGRAVHPIGPGTDLTRARALAVLTTDEQEELARLPQEISEADPTAKALNLDNAAVRVSELVRNIAAATNTVSDVAIDAMLSTHRRLVDAEAAERTASALLQGEDTSSLLAGTGQGSWAALFSAARSYSEAKARLKRFDRYILDKAAEAAQVARNAWKKVQESVDQAAVTFTVSQVMLESLGTRLETLPADIQLLQEDLVTRLEWLKTAVHNAEWAQRPGYRGPDPTVSLRQVAESLGAEAARLRANLDAEALAAKRIRLRELEARRLLSEHIDAIAIVRSNLAHRERLQRCMDDIANTRSISMFAGQLARSYVSDALTEKMNDELDRLDLYHVRAGINSSGNAGAVRLGVQLQECQLDPHLVLSEAEQRMCALAYFFAELDQSSSSSGIVFDDPVSSLDHNHRTAVARRIVQESANRQVILFTHDAVFFGELTSLCRDAQLVPEVRSINYRAEGPGYIDAGLPYDMRKHRERIVHHRSDHRRIVGNFNNPPGDSERREMRNAYDDLRVTIEVGIEDTILNETVVRFRDGISVGRLDGVIVVQEAEFREVQRLHDKCCRNVSAHSHAAGQQRPVTQPAELLQDIEAVNALFQSIRKRRG
jgi:hypothetical protein